MKTDIQIAQECIPAHIGEIAKRINVDEKNIEYYGSNKAKIKLDVLEELKDKKDGRLILVTAINPTKAGEGKTTTTVGLGDALSRLGKKTVLALREPSLGPVFGLKGGAAGGGYAQVVPMEDINLHFTGDMHAITTANNLISACLDNSIHQGNALNIDPEKVVWKRCLDMNDRVLRQVEVGLGSKANGVERKDGFVITVATEVMAILCLSRSLQDFKERIGKCIVAYTYDDKPVTVKDLGIVGALAVVMKDAMKPNLVQTLEQTPVFIHGGPFANIAHGCNSVLATKMALKLGDYVVTEAGFGADLGAEKFLDIKCREANLVPDMVVVVATIRALKMHGGKDKSELGTKDIEALEKGLANLDKHLENVAKFNLPYVVAINKFYSDDKEEVDFLFNYCKDKGHPVFESDVFSKGGEGGLDLAQYIVDNTSDIKPDFKFLYDVNKPIEEKIETICKEIYGADGVVYEEKALENIKTLKDLGFDKALICMAKTPNSLSDNETLVGRPSNFNITVKEVRLSAGVNFAVVLTGSIMTMPGLPKVPAATKIDIHENGEIEGLF